MVAILPGSNSAFVSTYQLSSGILHVSCSTPHMGYPQLLHLYPPEAILVGPGIAPEEVEEIFVEA
jgi:hypothetical protein